MGHCCRKISAFLRTPHDLRKKVKEVRTELGHVKCLLEAVLQIADDTRPVAAEFKTLVHLYTKQSRIALREHFEQHFNPAGRERLYHKDFENFFLRELDDRCHTFIEASSDFQSKVSLKEVLRTLSAILRLYKQQFSDDLLKVETLCALELGLFQACETYVEEEFNMSTAEDKCCEDDLSELEHEKSQQSIRLFCSKQKMVIALERIIRNHFEVFQLEFSSSDKQETFIQYRQQRLEYISVSTHYDYRKGKLLKWRRTLLRALKNKRPCNPHKGPSFRITLHIEKAAMNAWTFEGEFRQQCQHTAEIMRSFGSQRHEGILTSWISEIHRRWWTKSDSSKHTCGEGTEPCDNEETIFSDRYHQKPRLNHKLIYQDANIVITYILDHISTRAAERFARSLERSSLVLDRVVGVAQAIENMYNNPVPFLSSAADKAISNILTKLLALERNSFVDISTKNVFSGDLSQDRKRLLVLLNEHLINAGLLSQAPNDHIRAKIKERVRMLAEALVEVAIELFQEINFGVSQLSSEDQ